ncbi:MAG: hypothetical protein AB9856_00935 [Cellulosilyticaceae bacterium]
MKLEELLENGFTNEQVEMVKKVVEGLQTRVTELEKFKPVEKSQAEIDLDNRLKALEEKEQAIALKEKQATIQSKLTEKGLSADLSKYLHFEDDNFDTTLDEFEEVINKHILNNSFKPNEHKGNKEVITKEQFANMGYAERSTLMESNPTLYVKLSE